MRILPVVLLTFALLRPAAAADAEPTWRGKTAMEWLAVLVKEQDPTARLAAAVALRELSPNSEYIAFFLRGVLKDKDAMVRQLAAETFGRMDEGAAPAIPNLVAAVKDSDPHVRAAAAESLGRLGYLSRGRLTGFGDAVSVLTEALDDRHTAVRAAAAQALGGILSGGYSRPGAAEAAGLPAAAARAAADRLPRSLQDEDEAVRMAALRAMRWIGPPASAAEAALLKLKSDPAPDISSDAALALNWILPLKYPRTEQHVVYVVDRSGSVSPMFDFVKAELAKAVNKLHSRQKFNVVWFGAGNVLKLAMDPVPGTEVNKVRLIGPHLSDIQAQGTGDPREAMRAALEMRPDIIYLITDGDFDPEIVDEITKLNSQDGRGRVRINTIGIHPYPPDRLKNLTRLAEMNRGFVRAVDLSGLNR